MLVKAGVPPDYAAQLNQVRRIALLIVFGEVEGGRFNWSDFSWEKKL